MIDTARLPSKRVTAFAVAAVIALVGVFLVVRVTSRPAYEATAALAMILLRDHGVLTVHFAGLPPGTSSMLIKFVSPETLTRFGGPERFADAVDRSLDRLAEVIGDPAAFRNLLFGEID